MKRAVELSSAHPSWWDFGLFLGQYMLGNKAGAAQAADALATTKRPHYLAARLVVASEAGDKAGPKRLSRKSSGPFRNSPKIRARPLSTANIRPISSTNLFPICVPPV